jgi:serine phosphatase RsbU (regulator of sigma subunit)
MRKNPAENTHITKIGFTLNRTASYTFITYDQTIAMRSHKIHILLLLSIILFASCNEQSKTRPEMEDGFLDLSTWNFEEDGLVDLNGPWEFYWGALFKPEDFESDGSMKADYISVPGGWTVNSPEGTSYDEFGYATYRLRVKVPDKHTVYNFIFMSVFTSARVWVNGSFCFENGKVATDKENSAPQFTTNFYAPIDYNRDSDTLDIIVQVADYSYGGPAAGIRRKVTFGPDDQINQERIRTISINAFLIGILILIAIYHFFLYLYRTNAISYLIFALLSLVVVIWTIYSAGMFVGLFSYEGYLAFGHLGPALFPPLLVLFFYFLYRDEVHKPVLLFFLAIALTFILIIFVSSATTISNIFTLFSMNMMIPLAYLLGYSLLKAVIRKRVGSQLMYLSVLIMFATLIHDAFLANSYIKGFGFYISSYGYVLLIILQSLVLAQMFSVTFKRNINLTLNLEKIVEERTRTIEDQRKVLEIQNMDMQRQKEEIENQNEVLNQRNEEIEAQRDFARKQNEEITDSINYARRIQSAMLPPETYISELLIDNFILYKPRDIVSGDFYWVKQVKNYIVIVAADCTGHGIPGAFMSILGIGYLNEIVQRREVTQANRVLNELRRQIKNSLRQHGGRDESKDGMDMALCVLDLKNLTMQYAGANNPLYLIRWVENEAHLEEYKPDLMPIGYYYGKDQSFTNHSIKLEPGDTFYIFSDGYMDQKGGSENKKFLSRRFKDLLLGMQDQSMYDQKSILENTLSDWMGRAAQVDDILVVGVRV